MFARSAIDSFLSTSTRSVTSPFKGAAWSTVRTPDPRPVSTLSSTSPSADHAIARAQDIRSLILKWAFGIDVDSVELAGADNSTMARGDEVSLSTEQMNQATTLADDATFTVTRRALRVTWSHAESAQLAASTRDVTLDVNAAATLEAEVTRRQVRLAQTMAASTQEVRQADPLALDLSGTGVMTTGIEGGALFDLNGDGQTEQVSFVTGETWLLALDRDDNGRIDDGRELFGDQQGAAHGFEELARHDGNGDGVIDAGDEVFARLRLFQVREDGEQVLKPLTEAKVAAIELGYQDTRKAIDLYDSIAQIGRFRYADGRDGEAVDLMLSYRNPT